jgi:GNAT superfamily N-acetyltransferase
MSEIQVCFASQLFGDPSFPALCAAYESECANAVLRTPRPDRAMYEALERLGRGHCFGAYVGDELCGFAFVVTALASDYGFNYATVDRLFVLREARAFGLGALLMERLELHARNAGCAGISYSAPVGSQLARLLFLSSDVYAHTNYVFCRRLA